MTLGMSANIELGGGGGGKPCSGLASLSGGQVYFWPLDPIGLIQT